MWLTIIGLAITALVPTFMVVYRAGRLEEKIDGHARQTDGKIDTLDKDLRSVQRRVGAHDTAIATLQTTERIRANRSAPPEPTPTSEVPFPAR